MREKKTQHSKYLQVTEVQLVLEGRSVLLSVVTWVRLCAELIVDFHQVLREVLKLNST